MSLLVDIVLAFADLVEAKAQDLRRGVRRLALALVLMLVGGLLLALGLGLVVWGVYGVLTPAVGSGGAALIGGGVSVLAAVIIFLAGKWAAR